MEHFLILAVLLFSHLALDCALIIPTNINTKADLSSGICCLRRHDLLVAFGKYTNTNLTSSV